MVVVVVVMMIDDNDDDDNDDDRMVICEIKLTSQSNCIHASHTVSIKQAFISV